MRRLSIITALSLALLAACSGGGASLGSSGSVGGSSSGGSSSSSSSGGTTVSATSLTAISSATSIPADGSQSATITVLARNASNNLISGVVVSFDASTGGAIAVSGTGVTNSSGAATATLSAVSATPGTPITVTATAGDLTATVKVQVVTSGTAATTAVASLIVSSSAASILTDGSTTATITALALDAGSNVLAGVPVTFKTTSSVAGTPGALAASGATTGADGTLTGVLSTGGNSAVRTITVTGTTASLTSQVQVGVVAPTTPTAPVYSMGNGTGTGFVPNVIALGTTGTLAAGGATSVNITVVDQTGTLYNANTVTVTFNSTCLANGQAQILAAGSSTPTQSITTTTGSIGATYVAKGCSGTDTISASATVAGQSVGATGSVTIAAATVGSIQFVSASNNPIGLKGTGLNETSTVIFKVTDATGGAEAGVSVSFALNTSVGGLSLSPATATTASDGTVQTVVSSGTVHTVVRVTASIASPALSTQSSQLTVTTGLPASDTFSISTGKPTYPFTVTGSNPTLGCANVEAFSFNGVTIPVTVQLADRYGNPVPDGTAVAFQTDGGSIVGNCSTSGGTGTCVVTWTSADPRPGIIPGSSPPVVDLTYNKPAGYTPLKGAGRAVILATTIGEESFTDLYGTGFYEVANPPAFPVADPFANLGEPYEDDNEQPAYEVGDPFVDFYQKGTYVGPSGKFIGITCTGITAGSTCTSSTLAIGASHLVIMSSSNAAISFYSQTGFSGTSPNFSISQASSLSGYITVQIADEYGNAMPAGTGTAWTFSNPNAGVTLAPTPPTSVGCDSDTVTSGAGNETYQVAVNTTKGTTGVSGNLLLTVTAPSGSVTTTAYAITINP